MTAIVYVTRDFGFRRGEIYFADLDPHYGSEQGSERYVLIEKNPAFSRPSVVLLEQIFTIDKERINSFMGMTSEWEMAQIEKALKCSLALDRENIRNKNCNST